MSTRKATVVVSLLLVAAGAWYAFRPEKLFINAKVNEQFPTASAATQPVKLSAGSFHGVAHETKGVATIYQLPDGRKTIRLTEFETSNGPDVQVYLVAAAD